MKNSVVLGLLCFAVLSVTCAGAAAAAGDGSTESASDTPVEQGPAATILNAEKQKRQKYIASLKYPFDKSALRKFFGFPADTTFPLQPERVTDISKAVFQEYAIKGIPVIVTDGMRDWPGVDKWNCKWFSDNLPNEPVSGFTSYVVESLNFRRKLGDPFIKEISELKIPETEMDEKNPSIMSWYYSAVGISGVSGRKIERNKTAEQMIIDGSRLPYFVEKTALNEERFRERLEFFFGATNSGVHPHTDPICDWIMSGQLSGSKYWRLSLPYNIDVLEAANPGYQYQQEDGQYLLAAHMNQNAIFEFSLKAGEMVAFPPGMVHSTRVDSEECSTSTSAQFAEPLPVDYLVQFSQELISDSDGGPAVCFLDRNNYWLFGESFPDASDSDFIAKTFRKISRGSGKPISDSQIAYFLGSLGGDAVPMSQVDAYASYFIRSYDADGDGLVAFEEFAPVMERLWTPLMQKMLNQIEFVEGRKSAFDSVDINKDQMITEAEGEMLYGVPWEDLLAGDLDGSGTIDRDEWLAFPPQMLKALDLAVFGETKEDASASGLAIEADDDDDDDNEEEDDDDENNPLVKLKELQAQIDELQEVVLDMARGMESMKKQIAKLDTRMKKYETRSRHEEL